MGKKNRAASTRCLIVYIADGNSDGPYDLPSTSGTPATTTTFVRQAYALLPQVLLQKRSGLLRVLKENGICLLSESIVSSKSADVVKQQRIVEIRLSAQPRASLVPLDVECPAQCRGLLQRLFPRVTIRTHVLTRKCVNAPIDGSNVKAKAFKELVTRYPDIPCAFGTRANGTLIHWAVSFSKTKWETVLKLLLEAGADVNSLDSEQCTPLLRAIKAHILKMSQLLSKNGACAYMPCGNTSVLEVAYLLGPDGNKPSVMLKYVLERFFSHPVQFKDSESEFRKLLERILKRKSARKINRQSDFLCQHLAKVLTLHQLPNYDFLESRLSSVIDDFVPGSLRLEYETEIEQLKTYIIHPRKMSLYELLIATVEEMTSLMEDGSVSASLGEKKSLKLRYKFYGGILARRLEEGEDLVWLQKRDLPPVAATSSADAIARGFSRKKAPGFPSKAIYSRFSFAPSQPCHSTNAPEDWQEAPASLDLKQEKESNPNTEGSKGLKRHLRQIDGNIPTKYIKIEDEEQC